MARQGGAAAVEEHQDRRRQARPRARRLPPRRGPEGAGAGAARSTPLPPKRAPRSPPPCAGAGQPSPTSRSSPPDEEKRRVRAVQGKEEREDRQGGR